VAESKGKIYEEIQLDLAFVSEQASHGTVLPFEERAVERTTRTSRRSGLGKALATAREALLDASLDDLGAQLLSLFEFSEASLTRTLDVIPLRKAEMFSAEEYRSLRGIGQAQWLLSEAQSRQEMRATKSKRKKGKNQS
jgi:hypothetical protein